ncbi:hypothetical protein [Leptolyngbya sp. 7M]|nr:hypothetical protein [Leptolyngbya sp. 7M]QYO63447.1 hypothetical protein JVX88_26645 [Leptolyngbya sp. 7M]
MNTKQQQKLEETSYSNRRQRLQEVITILSMTEKSESADFQVVTLGCP